MSPRPGGEGGMFPRLGERGEVSLELEEDIDLTSVLSYMPCAPHYVIKQIKLSIKQFH